MTKITHEQARRMVEMSGTTRWEVDGEPSLLLAYIAQAEATERERDELRALHTPRPLAIRNGVADLMVDELAKQYQKAKCYGSLAFKWRQRALELGSKDQFEADGVSSEAALAYARGTLSHAWATNGGAELDEANAKLAAVVKEHASVINGALLFKMQLMRGTPDEPEGTKAFATAKALAEALK